MLFLLFSSNVIFFKKPMTLLSNCEFKCLSRDKILVLLKERKSWIRLARVYWEEWWWTHSKRLPSSPNVLQILQLYLKCVNNVVLPSTTEILLYTYFWFFENKFATFNYFYVTKIISIFVLALFCRRFWKYFLSFQVVKQRLLKISYYEGVISAEEVASLLK